MKEATENVTNGSSCNTLKMVRGKTFCITKTGVRLMSIITVGGHEVSRNLSEPSDQTIMHIDVYADYWITLSPQTTSRAVRASSRGVAANQFASTIGTQKYIVRMR